MAVDQWHLAHPAISDHILLEFLSRLGSDEEGLEPYAGLHNMSLLSHNLTEYSLPAAWYTAD